MRCAGVVDVSSMCGGGMGGVLGGGETAKWVGTAITSQAKVCAGRCFRFESYNRILVDLSVQ